MPKRKQYRLNDYLKAVTILAEQKGFRVEYFLGNKNAIRFEVFRKEQDEIWEMWTIHTEHSKKKEVWSKEDYRKPDQHLNARPGEFLEILETL
ncbi:MAG: hypothetical protein AAB690_02475 [Patescibacteria group bacterium]